MPLKEFLVKKLSLKLNTSERIIDTVISHQLTSAFQATSHHNEIELSGFGKFIFSQHKAHKQMQKYTEQLAAYDKLLKHPDSTPEIIRNTLLRIRTTTKNIEHLKPKLVPYEPKSNIRRVEESPGP